MSKIYQLTETEQLIHRLINDTRVKVKSMDVQDVTHEIATINHVRELVKDIQDIDLELLKYKHNLMAHLEDL